MVQAENSGRHETVKGMKLRSDRSFSERIMRRYAGARKRFPAMPQMILGKKASRFFSFRLNMLLSIALKIMSRYSLFIKDILALSDQTVSPSFFAALFGPRLQVAGNYPPAYGIRAKVLSRQNLPGTAVSAVKQVISASGDTLPAMLRHPQPAGAQRGYGEFRAYYGRETRHERVLTFSAKQFIRHAKRTFVDLGFGRQALPVENLKAAHERPVFVFPSGPEGTSAVPKQRRSMAAGDSRELIFRDTNALGSQIEGLRKALKKTEDRVRERVDHKLSEISAGLSRQVDIGDLTLQVYRSLERMIRGERERRGM